MVIVIFLVTLFVAPAIGQGANQPALITGRVVAAETSAPLRGVVVELVGGGGQPVATDADGRFELSERRVGTYPLRASKAGYVSNVFGAEPDPADQIEVTPGRRIDRRTIRLHRASVISGRVMDEHGEPIAEASVVAFRVECPQPGIGSWQRIKEVSTNDLGEYRIHGLMPGRYYMLADRSSLPPDLFVRAEELDHLIRAGGSVTSARSPSEPILVDAVDGGETGGMNLTLKHTRRVRVRGTVVDSSGRPVGFASVTLRPAQSVGTPFDGGGAQAMTKAGEFTFTNVAVGDYRVTVNADVPKPSVVVAGAADFRAAAMNAGSVRESASTFISITEDIPNLTVHTTQTKASAPITGSVFVDGVPVETATRLRYVVLPAGQQPMLPRMLAAGSITATQPAGRLGPGPGRFIITSANGVIILRHAGSPELSLKSVTANGVDVTDGFDATRSDMTVEVHLTTQGPVLKGIVNETDGTVAPGRDVVVFSVEPAYWTVPLSRRVTTVRSDDKGGFRLTGLPAGEYVAVAVTDLDRAMWADPERLQRLRAFATPFAMVDGARTEIKLEVKR